MELKNTRVPEIAYAKLVCYMVPLPDTSIDLREGEMSKTESGLLCMKVYGTNFVVPKSAETQVNNLLVAAGHYYAVVNANIDHGLYWDMDTNVLYRGGIGNFEPMFNLNDQEAFDKWALTYKSLIESQLDFKDSCLHVCGDTMGNKNYLISICDELGDVRVHNIFNVYIVNGNIAIVRQRGGETMTRSKVPSDLYNRICLVIDKQ